jgi:hypothetical protein
MASREAETSRVVKGLDVDLKLGSKPRRFGIPYEGGYIRSRLQMFNARFEEIADMLALYAGKRGRDGWASDQHRIDNG